MRARARRPRRRLSGGRCGEFEYCYRFLSANRFDPGRPVADRDLLDDGVLSVARFDAGRIGGLAAADLGQGPLTPANGFHNQADVLLHTRRAASHLLGATPMDAPEGYEPSPAHGPHHRRPHRQQEPPAGPALARQSARRERARPYAGAESRLITAAGPATARSASLGRVPARGDPANPPTAPPSIPTPAGRAGSCSRTISPSIPRAGSGCAATGRACAGMTACGRCGFTAQRRACRASSIRRPPNPNVAAPPPSRRTDGRCSCPCSTLRARREPGGGGARTGPDFAPGIPPRPSVIAITRRGPGGAVGG